MSNDYTPTTKVVQMAYTGVAHITHAGGPSALAPEFDRWLAKHDAEVAAKAELSHRENWATWIENHGYDVGTDELKQDEIVAALRSPHVPFGASDRLTTPVHVTSEEVQKRGLLGGLGGAS